jgi:hypothetical protein
MGEFYEAIARSRAFLGRFLPKLGGIERCRLLFQCGRSESILMIGRRPFPPPFDLRHDLDVCQARLLLELQKEAPEMYSFAQRGHPRHTVRLQSILMIG